MRGLRLIFVAVLLYHSPAFAQNLAPNPGFETYSSCLVLTNWSNYQNTVDLFNTCNATVPNNFAGNQAPLGGNGYVAGVNRHVSALYHEYFGAQLTSPLVIGTQYYCEVYISLTELSTIGASNWGFQFNTTPSASMNNVSQVYGTTVITDKTNWTLVSGVFTAATAFQYVAIGNFFSDALTPTLTAVGGSYTGAYYYFDGVLVTPNVPLPLEVVNLKAQDKGSVVDVAWTVASDVNTLKYGIERSADGKNFVLLGQVMAGGNNSGAVTYNFSDDNPVKGVSYYRIKQYDKNNSMFISSMVSVQYDYFTDGLIYPNPSTGTIMLSEKFPLPSTLEVFDISGRLVFREELTEESKNCDLSLLDKGTYFWQAGGRNGWVVRN